jgi:hypothetical protein
VCCHYISRNIEEIWELGGRRGREGKDERKVKEDEKDDNAKELEIKE